jgi:hypothetical protein
MSLLISRSPSTGGPDRRSLILGGRWPRRISTQPVKRSIRSSLPPFPRPRPGYIPEIHNPLEKGCRPLAAAVSHDRGATRIAPVALPTWTAEFQPRADVKGLNPAFSHLPMRTEAFTPFVSNPVNDLRFNPPGGVAYSGREALPGDPGSLLRKLCRFALRPGLRNPRRRIF